MCPRRVLADVTATATLVAVAVGKANPPAVPRTKQHRTAGDHPNLADALGQERDRHAGEDEGDRGGQPQRARHARDTLSTSVP